MFKILKKSKKSKARQGLITLPHGKIKTPFFMPDATRAVLKGVSATDLEKLEMPAMVVNTYHLYLQPGEKLIAKAGGVNKYMSFDKPLLSDSGGFQVFSLVHRNKEMGKIFDDRVEFKSPLNGAKHTITPKKSIQIQFDLGTDMIVVFDDCPPNDATDKKINDAVDRTIRWAKECRNEFDRQVKKRKLIKGKQPILFGVVQGGVSEELRKKCAEELVKIGFDGLGYGARPVDVSGNFLDIILKATADAIPENYLRFGLGIGMPEDIIRCVRMGWDMFDCVIPTREGRHGRLFVENPKSKIQNPNFYNTINIKNAKYIKDFSPINSRSKLQELRNYNKAYLHHLFKINDPLGAKLASMNNLEFYLDLMEKIRHDIAGGKF